MTKNNTYCKEFRNLRKVEQIIPNVTPEIHMVINTWLFASSFFPYNLNN